MTKVNSSNDVSKEQILESITIPDFTKIEGPFRDQFTDKEYYVGTVTDGASRVNVKFNLKYIEYGKVRVKDPVIE